MLVIRDYVSKLEQEAETKSLALTKSRRRDALIDDVVLSIPDEHRHNKAIQDEYKAEDG